MVLEEVKIEIYIPEEYVERLRDELNRVKACRLGNYDNCISITDVRGYWRPLEGSKPYSGREGEISKGRECKVEARCRKEYVKAAIEVIRRVHPY